MNLLTDLIKNKKARVSKQPEQETRNDESKRRRLAGKGTAPTANADELRELAQFIGQKGHVETATKPAQPVSCPLTQTSTEIVETYEKYVADCETLDDEVVKDRLKDLSEPRVLFGESAQERRIRYEIIAKTSGDMRNKLMTVYESRHRNQVEGWGVSAALGVTNADLAEQGVSPVDEIGASSSSKSAFEFNEEEKVAFMKSEAFPLPKDLEGSAKIKYFIYGLLWRWLEEIKIREASGEAGLSDVARLAVATCAQTRRDLRPLIRRLKDGTLEEKVYTKLIDIADLCAERSYVAAHDKYIELAIGNAAWPMGVTMVGIHERVGRSKIFSSEIAHILNDETTRKYIQMLKRLISICQKFYPHSDPSKMVSMASGSVPLL